MTDLTAITTPFGELPRATRSALFEAHQDGNTIEFYSCGLWLPSANPSYSPTTTYRVRPTPLTKDSIHWPDVSPQFIAMARDEDGEAFLMEKIPTQLEAYWHVLDGATTFANFFASYTRGTCDWKDSLVLRPGVAK